MAGFDRLSPALQYQIVHTLGFSGLRAVQTMTIDAVCTATQRTDAAMPSVRPPPSRRSAVRTTATSQTSSIRTVLMISANIGVRSTSATCRATSPVVVIHRPGSAFIRSTARM